MTYIFLNNVLEAGLQYYWVVVGNQWCAIVLVAQYAERMCLSIAQEDMVDKHITLHCVPAVECTSVVGLLGHYA